MNNDIGGHTDEWLGKQVCLTFMSIPLHKKLDLMSYLNYSANTPTTCACLYRTILHV